MTKDEMLSFAARRMRERAQEATRGPWVHEVSANSGHMVMDGDSVSAPNEVAQCLHYTAALNADHIASWHPIVALAVAAWLDEAARMFESFQIEYGDDAAFRVFFFAIRVAAVYLGEPVPSC